MRHLKRAVVIDYARSQTDATIVANSQRVRGRVGVHASVPEAHSPCLHASATHALVVAGPPGKAANPRASGLHAPTV